MRKLFPRALVALALAGFSSSAFALILDVNLLHGRRWQEMETDGEKNGVAYNQTTLAAHFTGLPIIGLGLSMTMLDMIAADKETNGWTSFTGTEIGLDVTAALSFVPIITPYARLNLPLMAKLEGKQGTYEQEATGVPLQTYWFTAGARYSIFPLLFVNAEVGTGVYMGKLSKAEDDGTNLIDGDDTAKNRKAAKIDTFLVGVGLDI